MNILFASFTLLNVSFIRIITWGYNTASQSKV